ncbi:MAG: hypothetical protein AAF740_02370 [Bacteroidota bacterium]
MKPQNIILWIATAFIFALSVQKVCKLPVPSSEVKIARQFKTEVKESNYRASEATLREINLFS